MKVLTHEDIMSLNIEPIQCYKWASEILENKNEVILPPKISMRPTEGTFYNIMPSLLPKDNSGGIKVVTRYPLRNPTLDSHIMLYDYNSGEMKALLDGNYITTMRTGAVAAHSVKLLAKKDFSKIGLIGLGNQARAAMKILLALYPDKKMVLKLMKYKDQHILFQEYIERLPNSKDIEFIFCDSYEDTVKGSDVIISSVTYFDKNICHDSCFDEGCLVVPIHTRGFMNCDLFFDKIFADDTGHVQDFKYFDKFNSFAETVDVITNKVDGRTNNTERILVYNIGLSMYDIYFAEQIYKTAQLEQVGETVPLVSPKDKFWI